MTNLQELVTTLRIFISWVEKYPRDVVAGAVATRALPPLAQATELCMRGVLEEYQAGGGVGGRAARGVGLVAGGGWSVVAGGG